VGGLLAGHRLRRLPLPIARTFFTKSTASRIAVGRSTLEKDHVHGSGNPRMKRTTTLALCLTLGTLAHAEPPKFLELPRLGIFRKKKEDAPTPPPAQQPQQVQPQKQLPNEPQSPAAKPASGPTKLWLDTLRSDPEEKKRKAAAENLASVDPRTTIELMPTLNAAMQQDPSATVRATVIDTVGKLKPINQESGAILELVVVSDPVEGVRKSAQAALWQYHLNGYRATSLTSPGSQTAEPPLAKPKAPPTAVAPTLVSKKSEQAAAKSEPKPQPSLFRPITTGVGRGAIYPQTIEPPLANTAEKAAEKPVAVRQPAKPEAVKPKLEPVKLEPVKLEPSVPPTSESPLPLPTIPMVMPKPAPVAPPTVPASIAPIPTLPSRSEIPSVPPQTIPSIPPPK
jgi:HEAT repeats